MTAQTIPRMIPAALLAALLLAPAAPAAGAPAGGAGQDVLSSESPRGGAAPREEVLSSSPEGRTEAPPPLPAPARGETAEREAGGIQVLNGNGARGNATLWAGRLRARDLPVRSVRNARRMDHPDTVIYYRDGAEAVALDVRRALGRRGRLVPSGEKGPYAVRVVLGRDILRRKNKKP